MSEEVILPTTWGHDIENTTIKNSLHDKTARNSDISPDSGHRDMSSSEFSEISPILDVENNICCQKTDANGNVSTPPTTLNIPKPLAPPPKIPSRRGERQNRISNNTASQKVLAHSSSEDDNTENSEDSGVRVKQHRLSNLATLSFEEFDALTSPQEK